MAGPYGTEYSYVGKGSLSAKVRGAADGLVPFGNVSALTIQISEEEKSQLDYQSAGGGQANAFNRIQSVQLGITMVDFVADNIAKALAGSKTIVSAGTGVTETVTAYEDRLIKLGKIGVTNLVVENSGGTVTYVAGVDYDLIRSSLWIYASGAIANAATLELTYDHPAQNVVQALVSTGLEYELFFDGLNEAQSGDPAAVTFYRARLGAASELALISDDYSNIALTAKVIKDTTIVGAGLSQYMKYAGRA